MTITNLDEVRESGLTWPEDKPRSASRQDSPFMSRVPFYDNGSSTPRYKRQRPQVDAEEQSVRQELARWSVREFIVSRNRTRTLSGSGDVGVAVWWVAKDKSLRVLACDRWATLGENMHAIVLTLDAMRGLERWGAYTAEQAAEGAKLALPPPAGSETIDWRLVLAVTGMDALPKADLLDIANARYRRAAANASGDDAELRRLNLAIEAARKDLGA